MVIAHTHGKSSHTHGKSSHTHGKKLRDVGRRCTASGALLLLSFFLSTSAFQPYSPNHPSFVLCADLSSSLPHNLTAVGLSITKVSNNAKGTVTTTTSCRGFDPQLVYTFVIGSSCRFLQKKDALILARTNIKAALETQGSEREVIKHYQTAKNALAGVDVTKTEIVALREPANTESLIPLEHLFNKRLRDGMKVTPKRILVQGRAGIGKTTLCKKLVHVYQSGLCWDLFDAVLWLPLRQLRGSKSRTLEGLFREKLFIVQGLDQEQAALANALAIRAQKGNVLFILDGLDEIVADTGSDESRTFRAFLKTLLEQQHVAITSRPSGVDRRLLPPIDLDLETVGSVNRTSKTLWPRYSIPKQRGRFRILFNNRH